VLERAGTMPAVINLQHLDTLSPEQLRTVREACTRWLGWQEGTWQQEWQRYQDILTHHYRLPVRAATERVHHG